MIMVSSINLQLPAWEKRIGSTIEGKTLLVSTIAYFLLLIQEIKIELIISNIYIQIIFENSFVTLRILEAKYFTKKLLILWTRRVPLLVKLVEFYHCIKIRIYWWFIDNSGKEASPNEKPLDTFGHKVNRNMWVKEWYTLLRDKLVNIIMLD